MKFLLIYSFSVLILLSSGQLRAQKYYDKKHGKYSEVVNGGLVEGHLKNHLQTGEWITHYPGRGKGPAKSYENYTDGILNGSYALYDRGGNLSEVGSYKMGKKNGKWINYNEDGSVRSFANYRNDTLDGTEEGYYPNGKLSVRYVWSNGEMISHEMWNDNGIPLSGEYYRNGKPNGRCWSNPSGESFDTSHISFTYYTDGKKNGEAQAFSNDGSRIIYHYINDTLNGLYISYDAKGALNMTGYYLNGKPDGKWKTIYPSGQTLISFYTMSTNPDSSYLYSASPQLMVITRFNHKQANKVFVINYDSGGVISEYGSKLNLLKDSVWTTVYPGGKVRSKVAYIAGVASGNYTAYYPNGKKIFSVNVIAGRCDSTPSLFDMKGKKLPVNAPQTDSILRCFFFPVTDIHYKKYDDIVPANAVDEKSDEIFTLVDQQPEFPGGEAELMKWLQRNLKYPAAAKDMGLQGTVYIKFVVEKDGTVSNAEVVKKAHPYLDNEALRVVSVMPKWNPGTMQGKPVRVYYNLPVRFVLR